MPRQERTKSGTGIYHVMLRGINRQDIFEDDEDYLQMTACLQGLTERYDENGVALEPLCTIYSYCLMSNHIHLLVREQKEDISSVMKRLGVAYAYYFNKKYQRNGHLFQDRFRSEPVNDMGYFVTLLRYIHQNPIAAGIASSVDAYTWSSWCEYDDAKPCALPVCTTQHVFSRISKDNLTALVNDPLPKALNILDFGNETAVRVTDEKVREYLHTICNNDNLTEIQHYTKNHRNDIIRMAKDYGASIRQISRITGVSEGIIRKI